MSIEYKPLTGVGRFNAKLNGATLRIKHRLAIVANIMKPVSATELAKFQQAFRTCDHNWTESICAARRVNVKPRSACFRDTATRPRHFCSEPEQQRRRIYNVDEMLRRSTRPWVRRHRAQRRS